MAYLSYLGSHWTLFVIVVLSAVALGGLAWFTKNLKFVIAAVVLVVFGLAYQSANMDGYKRRVNEEAQAQVKVLQTRLLALSMITAEDTKRATADSFLNTKLDQLSRETPANTGVCLDADAARRVRSIGAPDSHATPLPSRRHTSLFPWRRKRS